MYHTDHELTFLALKESNGSTPGRKLKNTTLQTIAAKVIMKSSGCQQDRRENSEAPGQKRQVRPPASEASRKFLGSRN